MQEPSPHRPEEASSAAVMREVLRLTGPAVLTSLLQTVVFLADRVMLGRHGEASLASMQISGPVLWSVFSIFFGSLAGTVAMIARNIGAGDHGRASAIARTVLRLSALLGLAVGVLGCFGAGLIAELMTPADTPEISALATDYMQIALVGFPFVFVASAGALVLNASGDTRITFKIGVFSNLVNVAINYVLIYGHTLGPIEIPELGPSGAAIGTLAAYAVEAVLIIAVLRSGSPGSERGFWASSSPIRVARLWERRFDPSELSIQRALVRLSLPAVAERLVIHLGFLAFARVITSLGGGAMAANQALVTLESICFLAAEGFGVAAATVVGQYLGRGQPEAARRGGFIASASCAAALTGCGLLIWASAPWTLHAFVPVGESGTELIAIGLATMPVLVISQPVMAAAVVLGHGLRGAGDTRSPLLAAVVGGLVIRVSGAWLLARGLDLGLVGIWTATCVDWTLRTILLGVVFVRGRWRSIAVD